MDFKLKIKGLIISVLILSTICMSFYIFYKFELNSNEFREDNDNLNLKPANYWNLTGTPIYIDDTAVGTYDWATINATYNWCTGSGTQGDPYILENIEIDGLNSDNCIEIWYSSVYFTIRNCTLYNSGDSKAGIKIEYSDNAKVINNTCLSNYHGIFTRSGINYNISNNIVKDNTQDGITLESFLDNCTIKGNKAINNFQHGIVLRQDCNDIIISDNIVKDHIYSGIIIQGGSENNKIVNNSVIKNDGFAGIWIYNSDDNIIRSNNLSSNIGYGMEITESNNNTVIENIIYNNTIYGIEFSSWISNRAEYNKIINNTITSNIMAGIHMDEYSINNTIYLNNFTDNNINGYDEGINNTNNWDNGTIGNYWDDYSGVDNDDDGIGDTSYTDIGGTVGAQDNFPIWWDPPAFSIISPLSDEQFGDIAPNYIISIDGGYNDTMWYTLDNGLTNHTFVNISGSIDQSLWNNTAIGIVTIRFYMNDSRGFISYEEVSIEKVRIDTYWFLSPFIIDDSGGGDYTWVEATSYGWCSGTGTLIDPYIIEYLKIDGQTSSSCLTIQHSNAYFIISNSSFSNSSGGFYDAGIKLHYASNGLIISNNCSFNNGNGIVLSYCQFIIITENSINSNNISGILLFNSDANLIFNNDETIKNNTIYGILLLYSNYNNITNNLINDNNYGVYLQEANYNSIINNDLFNNIIPYNIMSGEGNSIEDISFPIEQPKFPFEILIIILIIGIVAVGVTGSALIIKKRRSPSGFKDKKEISEKKKEKIRIKLEEKLDFVDYLIRERNIRLAYKNLGKIKDTAEIYDFFAIFNTASEKVERCKVIEGRAKGEIKEEDDKTTKEVETKEEIVTPPLIKREENLFNLFISYSTIDRDYFQIKKIVKELKKYPRINKISYWERDSKANIVEFMDETLEVSNTFILFCSENSVKSDAVKDEWQAAFQMRKQGLIKLIPVYEKQNHIPKILWHLLNVKYQQEDLKTFIENLYKEILRE